MKIGTLIIIVAVSRCMLWAKDATATRIDCADSTENKSSSMQQEPQLRLLLSQCDSLISVLKATIIENKSSSKSALSLQPTPTSTIKAGFLTQAQGQALQEQTTSQQDTTSGFSRHWQRQVFLRRLRVLLGGYISENTSFFFESDETNIGKVSTTGSTTVKSISASMYVQDAYIQHTFAPELSIIAGLQLVGITRNGLQSAASLMGLDYGKYQFVTSAPLDNVVGRDVGVNLRGFVLDERLEYRIGIFSGKSLNLYSPLRPTIRLNYMFEDREKGFFYTGTTLGKGRLLSIGAGLDAQGSYIGYAADAMVDLPVFCIGSLTASASLSWLDGGGSDIDSTYFTGVIPKQRVFFGELGYFFTEYGFQPYLKYEDRSVNATVLKQVGATNATLALKNSLGSEDRFGIGLNYFINGHNASVKVLYELVTRNRLSLDPTKAEKATNSELTVQFEYFSF